MSSKPGDFLIGVGEFIGILLPGSVVAYVSVPALRELAIDYGLPPLDGTAGWVAIIVMAYIGGHLVFLIGSFLDKPYDWIRRRYLARENDHAYQIATRLAKQQVGAGFAAMNTYKFATATLVLHHQAAHAEVKQFEADSKFFRSLVVVGLGTIALAVRELNLWLTLGAVVATVMCTWRYVEQRWKATHRAYEYVVMIYGSMNGGAT